jgi:hypothetical protein
MLATFHALERDVDSTPTYEPDQNRSAMYTTIFQHSDR